MSKPTKQEGPFVCIELQPGSYERLIDLGQVMSNGIAFDGPNVLMIVAACRHIDAASPDSEASTRTAVVQFTCGRVADDTVVQPAEVYPGVSQALDIFLGIKDPSAND